MLYCVDAIPPLYLHLHLHLSSPLTFPFPFPYSLFPIPFSQNQIHPHPSRANTYSPHITDHIGGHIRTSTHIPSTTLDHQIPTLVRKLQDKEIVVFHCALSQQRGPGAAVRYLRERERLLGGESKGGSGSGSGSGINAGTGKALKRNAVDRRRVEGEGEVDNTTREVEGDKDADGEWEDIDEQGDKEGEAEEKKQQKVYVLDRGFVGWQELYGEDSRLTEGYRKEIWKEGYWM